MSFDEEKLLKEFARQKGTSSRHADTTVSSTKEPTPAEFRAAEPSTTSKKKMVPVNHDAEYWSVKEACAVAGFAHTTFYELRKSHGLPSYRPKGFGRRVVKQDEFLKWLEQVLWVGDRDARRVG